mmetsp:Transcript_5618/g.7035  ORF Transcript_5618/g.7035 Transcript_5618/m.7035 type:complete len:705 (-) Transcript_5618:101-2215(-)|eukprot:CAMPEP_0172501156 /NCGR_PEP_ID=MMETSP1066-20121228/146730_1 /TAXON_ID=671091 /ORGANISM="Coscinodiscus wailesii, Strain CCMP2513" /LENGTH=704 /DNA_ID=CAMNT_0013275783 /DNA_START=216 /DNA_END=2330 /DNA_ORIENTATION=-
MLLRARRSSCIMPGRRPVLLAGVFSVLIFILETNGSSGLFNPSSGKFLYKGDAESPAAIIDYEEVDNLHPAFLASEENGPRIVEFYSPWCGHCKMFKPRYISAVKEVTALVPRIKFYAISCQAHHKLCNEEKIMGYPTVRAYKDGETTWETISIKKFDTVTIFNALGISPDDEAEKEGVAVEEEGWLLTATAKERAFDGDKGTVDVATGTEKEKTPLTRATKMRKYLYEDVALVKEYTEVGNDHPSFVYSAREGERVILFYDPLCETCQRFKSTYGKLAAAFSGSVPFYAISCKVHKKLCSNFNLSTYPALRVYKKGDGNGKTLSLNEDNEENDKYLEVLLRRHLDPPPLSPPDTEQSPQEQEVLPPPSSKYLSYPHTSEEMYSDAALSLQFSLQSGVYNSNGPLSPPRQKALKTWLQLLQRTLPHRPDTVFHQSHLLLDDLLASWNDVIASEDGLEKVLRRHPAPARDWSASCHKGSEVNGYTCGLWSLFHVMTLGLVHYNQKGTGGLVDGLLSPVHAADALREFVAHFFACQVCQAHFLTMYDHCEFDRCNRLTDGQKGLTTWKQLPLWLWETHNDVNVRLLKEQAESEQRGIDDEEEQRGRWPPSEMCPRCWKHDGSWDEGAVYAFLYREYWSQDELPLPAGSSRKAAAAADTLETRKSSGERRSIVSLPLAWVLTPSIGFFCWYVKRRQLELSGRHKKGF